MEVFCVKINWKALLISIAIPLAVGAASAWLTRDSMNVFATINKPPLSPPGWLFPIVWTILYVLMGIASYLIYTSDADKIQKKQALQIYGFQLFVNFLWSIFFFNYGLYQFSFIWLVLLWVLIIFTIIQFREISKPAGLLLVPYLAWVTFAGYLNFAIYLLN